MTDGPMDQAHERAGYALIAAGILIALLAAGAVLAAALGAQLEAGVMPLVYVAAIGAALAGFGALTLLGVRHYGGLRASGPGGASIQIDSTCEPNDREQ